MTTPAVWLQTEPSVGSTVTLTGDSHFYLSRVLRSKPGEQIVFMVPNRGTGCASIRLITSSSTTVYIESFEASKTRDFVFSLIISPLKNRGTGDIVEFATQLGINNIVLTRFARSVSVPTASNVEHLRRAALESARGVKQTLVPAILVAESLRKAVQLCPGRLCFLDERSGQSLAELTLADSAAALVVAPEGGFDSSERDLLMDAGAVALHINAPAITSHAATIAGVVLMLRSGGAL